MKPARIVPLLLLSLVLCGCAPSAPAEPTQTETETQAVDSLPQAQSVLEKYLTACCNGNEVEARTCLLPPVDTVLPLDSFRIWGGEQLNDCLWCFTAQQQTGTAISSGFLFVGSVEEILYVFPTAEQIPAQLCNGLDISVYYVPAEAAEPTEPETTEPETTQPETEETVPPTTEQTVPVTTAPSTTQPTTANPSGSTGSSGCVHNFIGNVHDEYNCLTGGTRYYTCWKCDYVMTENLSAKGRHTMTTLPSEVYNKFATCTSPGYVNTVCTRCGYVEEKPDPVNHPALGHAIVDTVVPPTTTAPGYTEHFCTRCHLVTMDNYVDPLPTQPPAETEPET